jgi:hypothetical protein
MENKSKAKGVILHPLLKKRLVSAGFLQKNPKNVILTAEYFSPRGPFIILKAERRIGIPGGWFWELGRSRQDDLIWLYILGSNYKGGRGGRV